MRLLATLTFTLALLLPLAAVSAPPEALAAARALLEANRDAEAQRAYEAIVRQDPSDPEPFRRLGQLALRRDDPDAAVTWLEQAVALAPDHAETHRVLGDSLGRKAQRAGVFAKFGLARRCLAAYERAAALDPSSVRAHESLFGYYVNAPGIAGGGKDKALAEAEALKRLDAARGALAFATLYQAENKFAEALAEYDTYLGTAPDDFYVNYLVGKLCDTNGLAPERGLAALRHCLELPPLAPPDAPKHQHAHWRIGNILRTQGDLAGARAAYEAALAIDPGFSHAADALKRMPAAVARGR